MATVGDGAQWPNENGEPKKQPLTISLTVPYDLKPSAAFDDVEKSVNYGTLSRALLKVVDDGAKFTSLEALLDAFFNACFTTFPDVPEAEVSLMKTRAMPYAESVAIHSRRLRTGARLQPDRFSLNKLACNLIVGLNPCEREDKQLVYFDVDIERTGNVFDWRRLGQHLRKVSRPSTAAGRYLRPDSYRRPRPLHSSRSKP